MRTVVNASSFEKKERTIQIPSRIAIRIRAMLADWLGTARRNYQRIAMEHILLGHAACQWDTTL